MSLSLADVRAAAERIAGRVERTPMRKSQTLSEITGAEVWVKFENLQFTAAYKERGALNTLLQLSDNESRRGVIAASAGNHSQGLAYHAARLGIPVTIVMPRSTPLREGAADPGVWRRGGAGGRHLRRVRGHRAEALR
jgi:threonine dehydratase